MTNLVYFHVTIMDIEVFNQIEFILHEQCKIR